MRPLQKRLQEFVQDDSLGIGYLEIKSAAVHETVKKMRKAIGYISTTLSDMEIEDYYGEEQLWKDLEDLASLTKKRILEAGRRFK